MSSGHALVRSKCLVSSCMLNFYCMNPTLCNGGSDNIKLNRKPQLHNHLMSILHQNRSFESIQFSSVQFISVAQSCLTLCDPMNGSTPGFPVHHQFPEFTQTHVHRVCGAIQPSHPLSSPSPPASNPSQHQSLFQ